jgi:hypothetical protein
MASLVITPELMVKERLRALRHAAQRVTPGGWFWAVGRRGKVAELWITDRDSEDWLRSRYGPPLEVEKVAITAENQAAIIATIERFLIDGQYDSDVP